jgi:hypothetical protein
MTIQLKKDGQVSSTATKTYVSDVDRQKSIEGQNALTNATNLVIAAFNKIEKLQGLTCSELVGTVLTVRKLMLSEKP